MGKVSEPWAAWASPQWTRFLGDRLKEIAKAQRCDESEAAWALGRALAGVSSKQRRAYFDRVRSWLEDGQTATYPLAFRAGQELARLGARSSGPLAAFAAGHAAQTADFILRLCDEPSDRAAIFHAARFYFTFPLVVEGGPKYRDAALNILDQLAKRGASDLVSPAEFKVNGTDVGHNRYAKLNVTDPFPFKNARAKICADALVRMRTVPNFEIAWNLIRREVQLAVNSTNNEGDAVRSTFANSFDMPSSSAREFLR